MASQSIMNYYNKFGELLPFWPTILELSDFTAHYGIPSTNFSCLFGGAR